MILLFKSFDGNGPRYIKDFFKRRIVNSYLRGSGTKLEQNYFNSKWRLNSSVSSHVWNSKNAMLELLVMGILLEV